MYSPNNVVFISHMYWSLPSSTVGGILFLIVGGVVGGCVLLVVMLCSTFIVCYLLRRSHRGGKMNE